ncbi:MAG: T9SS type A sorting domain-containing protein [Chlorobi bacterium]|nr:T9SS type A sorting domain-containing protein [Chlorobiota bacterium]
MKIKLLFFMIVLFSAQLFAQEYPEVSIRDIQYISNDSLLTPPYDYPSQLNGDTVTVTGIVMNAPYYSANPDSGAMLIAGAPAMYLQDADDPVFGGMFVRFPGATSAFGVLDTGMVVKCTGVVAEYFTTTQLNLIDFQPEDVVDFSERPKPVVLTLDSLVEIGTSDPNYLAEKWEHVYVEIRNVTATDIVSIGSGSFGIFDENNSMIVVGNQSDYFRNRVAAPRPGTSIDYIRGYINNRTNMDNGWFLINPVYPDDIKYGDVIPPDISNITRDKGLVGYGDEVNVSADILDADGIVNSAKIMYKVNGGELQEADMALTAGNTYIGTLPAFNDSTIVSFYIMAEDNDGALSYNPSDTLNGVYFYYVLDRDLTIQDVQRSPFGSGYSAYNNFEVTVSGVVTADTSDITADGGRVYIQNGTGPWSGIKLFGTEIYNLQKGDEVTVTGTVRESYGLTQIEGLDTPESIVVNGTTDVPEPYMISTEEIDFSSNGDLPAESYESVLIKYENVTVVDENADGDPGPGVNGNRNYGEMVVQDNSGEGTRVELQDGNNDYHNFWDASLENEPIRIRTWNHFDELVGVLYYAFGNFKLVPRTNADFVGFVTGVDDEEIASAETYSLKQNYPNPFNPTTIIEFTIPQNGFVSLKIYNLLGEVVAQLVNEELSSGVHHVQFNAANLPSGIYFYRMKAGDFIDAKKLVLLK